MRIRLSWPRSVLLAFPALLGMHFTAAPFAEAKLTMKSPEVKEAVSRGVDYLSANGTSDNRLGAYALAGMALLISGEKSDHPTVTKCAESIVKEFGERNVEKLDKTKFDIYSSGMSIIFLVDRDKDAHRADIEFLLRYMQHVQKPHGGWGYDNLQTGDTSMTQYGVLSAWVSFKAGFSIPADSVNRVALWLIRTQDPSGGFGYQGKIGDANKLVQQDQVKQSLSAAGLGSVYACSDMLGLNKRAERRDKDLPGALREIKPKENRSDSPTLKPSIASDTLHTTTGRGNQWFAQNFKVDAGQYNHYYLYAFERYMSFRAHCEGTPDEDPQWYSDIAEHLLKTQEKDGSWRGDCGQVCDTAFSVLFLLRSMQKKLKMDLLGDGLLTGARGLPKDFGKATLDANGKVVTREKFGPAESLLAALGDPRIAEIDESANLLEDLPDDAMKALMDKHGDKLRGLVSNKSPVARLVVVRGLGKTRDLDNVEVLLYALTDPVPEVAVAANEALLRIRRSPGAIVLPEKFTEEDRRLVIEQWKAWYLSIRPDAKLE